jgi:putative two-component system hydrogenase maturation factor HypX/HoxX
VRILFLTHSFNSLTQRLYSELTQRGHEVSLEFDIADSVAEEAVALFRPDLIVAPYLRRAIPESIWRSHVCLVIHPGIVGDRGPSALDWVIQSGESAWGVTVLQAEAAMDAGPIWATADFPMRRGRKASIYRNELTEAACRALLLAVERFVAGAFRPTPLAAAQGNGRLRPMMTQDDRRIDWSRDDTATVLRKIDAADGFPGVADELFGEPCHLFDAWPEAAAYGGSPGMLIGRRETALLRATTDGAVWIGHVKRNQAELPIKLPAAMAFPAECATLPELHLHEWWKHGAATWQDIAYEESDGVGTLHFDFYNGATSTRQCQRLLEAYTWARTRPTRVIVLMGGSDFWSNGIHLNVIEAAESPADESWCNINAIDDLAAAIITTDTHLTVAALRGNAGAGGAFLARAADEVWARDGVLLNPHYKNMGNLYGSEYWTYLLPPRVGDEGARAIMQNRLPLTAQGAVNIGFIDRCLGGTTTAFGVEVGALARRLAEDGYAARLAAKRERRRRDEAAKPLARYREEELDLMRRNFYGFDPSYHVARYHFVRKSPQSWTPRHLAKHRELGWKVAA